MYRQERGYASERSEHNPDVNSPFVDDDYDSDQHLLETDKQYDIPEPEGDDNVIRHPDIDEPYPTPQDEGDDFPVEEPPFNGLAGGRYQRQPENI